MSEPWPYKFFTPDELRCKHTGKLAMDAAFMTRLELLRERFGAPMVVTSGYRDPSHPAEAKKDEPGTHTQGIAVDIAIQGAAAVRLIELALPLGFRGVGIQQKGHGQTRFVHLDTRHNPMIWSY